MLSLNNLIASIYLNLSRVVFKLSCPFPFDSFEWAPIRFDIFLEELVPLIYPWIVFIKLFVWLLEPCPFRWIWVIFSNRILFSRSISVYLSSIIYSFFCLLIKTGWVGWFCVMGFISANFYLCKLRSLSLHFLDKNLEAPPTDLSMIGLSKAGSVEVLKEVYTLLPPATGSTF